MAKQKSRPQRWGEALATAQDGLAEAIEVAAEYEEWRENLPENMESSGLAEKLDAMVELKATLEEAQGSLEEAESADLPQGYGRD